MLVFLNLELQFSDFFEHLSLSIYICMIHLIHLILYIFWWFKGRGLKILIGYDSHIFSKNFWNFILYFGTLHHLEAFALIIIVSWSSIIIVDLYLL